MSAPLRLSLAGGGTDLPEYWCRNEAQILSVAVNARVFTTVRSGSKVVEETALTSLFRKRNMGFYVDSVDCAVSHGAGLGGSGAVSVCLVAIERYLSRCTWADVVGIGLEAYRWEREILRLSVGFQDQLAAALGGCVEMVASPEGAVRAWRRDDLVDAIDEMLENQILIVETGHRRPAQVVLERLAGRLTAATPENLSRIAKVQEVETLVRIRDGEAFGTLLDRHWQGKRAMLPEATRPSFEVLIATAKKAGATGGKIIGAGGGGFLMVSGPVQARRAIEHALGEIGCPSMPLRVDRVGIRLEETASGLRGRSAFA